MKQVRIYTTNYCPYCTQAKNLLGREKISFTEINVENDPNLRAKLMAENHGYRTVPMIFFGDEFIGGFSELQSLQSAGKLREKLY